MDITKYQHVLTKYKSLVESEMEAYVRDIKVEELVDSFQMIENARSNGNRVHVTGIGKPAYVAGYIASLFSSTGTPAYVLHATEAIHGSSGQVLEGDIVIAISNSGETEELKSTVLTLKKNKAKIISVTGHKESWLAQQGDTVLLAGVEEEGGPLNKAPRISYLAEIVILQALSVILQEGQSITLQDYKKWHPGGALGQSIK